MTVVGLNEMSDDPFKKVWKFIGIGWMRGDVLILSKSTNYQVY